MSEWKEYKLGELADVQTGPFGSQLHASDYVPVGIPSIMPTNIGNRLEIRREEIACIKDIDAKRLEKYRVISNDIVYSRRGDVEKCAFITEKESGWLCGTGCLRLRFTALEVIPKFAAYYLSTNEIKGWISSNAVGTTMPNLNTSILNRLPILLPTFSIQQSITSILSSIDDKIDLLYRQNATLEKIAETLFRQWFVEETKEDWKMAKLGVFIQPKKGKNITKSEAEEGVFPVVAGGIEPSCFHNQSNTKEPVITISSSGANAGFVKLYNSPVWSSDSSFIDETVTTFVYTFYVFLKMNQELIFDKQEGSAQPHIYPSHIMDLDIPSFPIKLIENFESIIKSYFQKIKTNQTQIRTLTALRDTLLPKLMSGEVRLEI